MAKERMDEIYKNYPIPYNFIDESKMFGGMVKTRNFVEGCICSAIASIPVFVIPFIGLYAKVLLFIILVIPALVFGIIGINGDPISKFLIYYIKFRKTRRIVSFNNKVKLHERIDVNAIAEVELPRDKILKLFNNLGSRREKAEEHEIATAEEFIFDDDLDEIKKKEEAKQMLKASSKYNQTKASEIKYNNIADSFNYDVTDNEINESDISPLSDETDDVDCGDEHIPILEEILSDPTDDVSDYVDFVENKNLANGESIDAIVVFEEEQKEFVVQEDEPKIIMLAGDFIDDYNETKIIEPKAQGLLDTLNTESVINNQNVHVPQNAQVTQDAQVALNTQTSQRAQANSLPAKKPLILPWYCQCGTRNSGKFCSECGKPKP